MRSGIIEFRKCASFMHLCGCSQRIVLLYSVTLVTGQKSIDLTRKESKQCRMEKGNGGFGEENKVSRIWGNVR